MFLSLDLMIDSMIAKTRFPAPTSYLSWFGPTLKPAWLKKIQYLLFIKKENNDEPVKKKQEKYG